MKITLALSFVLLIAVTGVATQEKPKLRDVDRIRLAEAFRLKDKLGDDLWAD